MSDFHILEVNNKKDRAHVVFHFDTPAGNNAANIARSTAYVQWVTMRTGAAPATILPSTHLLQAESDAITAGTVIEHDEVVQFNANATNVQKQAIIAALWTTLNGTIPGRVQENIKFWGFSGDV